MALQSQMARSNTRTKNISFVRSGGQKKIVGAAVLILAVGGGFWYLLRDKGPQAALADNSVTLPTSTQAAPPSTPAATPVAAPATQVVDERIAVPLVLSQPQVRRRHGPQPRKAVRLWLTAEVRSTVRQRSHPATTS